MSAQAYFVAGTDTGVGKTRVTAALLAAGRSAGMVVAGMKPVASGAEWIAGRLASADALQLAAASGQSTAYDDLNPYCLEEAISPHIAAKMANITVDIGKIAAISARLGAEADLLLIEGAGGWYTPIGGEDSMAELARALQIPVVLVVGLKLGCLNHARLTREAIARSGCGFAGWIGNHIDPGFAAFEENLATLNQLMGTEALGLLPHSLVSGNDAALMRAALVRLLASRCPEIT